MLPGRRLTLLVIPEEGGRTYEYKVPRLLLWLVLAGAAVVLVLLMVGGRAFYENRHLEGEVVRLERDREVLSEEVQLVEQLEVMLRELESSNRQLRSITAEAVGLDTRTSRERSGRVQPTYISLTDRLRFGNLRTVPTLAPVAAEGWQAYDGGVLFPAPRGSLVVAAAAGRVERTGYDPDRGYTVTIDHRNGVLSTYGGLGWLVVEGGGYVQKGQPLGLTGWPRDGSTPGVRFSVFADGREVTQSLGTLWL